MAATITLDDVLPVGEPCEDWHCDSLVVRGVTEEAARRYADCSNVEPVYVRAVQRCPRFDGDYEEINACCGGACLGDPHWRYCAETDEGAEPAWKVTW